MDEKLVEALVARVTREIMKESQAFAVPDLREQLERFGDPKLAWHIEYTTAALSRAQVEQQQKNK